MSQHGCSVLGSPRGLRKSSINEDNVTSSSMLSGLSMWRGRDWKKLTYCQTHIPTGPVPSPCSMCVYQPTQTMTDSLCSAEVWHIDWYRMNVWILCTQCYGRGSTCTNTHVYQIFTLHPKAAVGASWIVYHPHHGSPSPFCYTKWVVFLSNVGRDAAGWWKVEDTAMGYDSTSLFPVCG